MASSSSTMRNASFHSFTRRSSCVDSNVPGLMPVFNINKLNAHNQRFHLFMHAIRLYFSFTSICTFDLGIFYYSQWDRGIYGTKLAHFEVVLRF